MPLISASLLPHSPLLIPEIGQAHFSILAKSAAAYERTAALLKEREVDTLIILSPHSPSQPEAFVINVAPEMAIDFKDFGYITARTGLVGDAPLADQISSALRPAYPIQLISETPLDHGSAIPLYLLKNSAPEMKVIVISPASGLSLDAQLDFGLKMREIIAASEKKIAVVASGDLSHRLKKKSPGGYSPKGAKFDNKLIEYLSDPLTAQENILKMDKKLIEGAGECGLKPIVILLGLLSQTAWQPEVLAYQTEFGVGYLSLEFKF